MSVAPKMLTERQQLAIALRESMTAASARVDTPDSVPRSAPHSPAGYEVRAPDTTAGPQRRERESHFQNAVGSGSCAPVNTLILLPHASDSHVRRTRRR